jgi:hypothetical protein
VEYGWHLKADLMKSTPVGGSGGLRFTRRAASPALFLLSFLLVPVAARADVIQIDTGLSLSSPWTRSGATSISPSFVIPIQNTLNTTNSFNGWSLALEIVPEAGASGTVTINAATNPSGNALSAPDNPSNPLPALTDSIGGHGTFYEITNSNTNTVDNVGTGNIVSLTFATTNSATGVFDLVAINNSDSGGFGDPLSTSYNNHNFTTGGANSLYSFSNVPFPTSAGGVLLGTINISGPTGVPEPGSFALAMISSVSLYLYRGRRRKKSAADPAVPGPAPQPVA